MSERLNTDNQNTQHTARRAIALGLIAVATAGGGVLAEKASALSAAEPVKSAQKVSENGEKGASIFTATESKASFYKLMNSRVRTAAIGLTERINKGPSKPTDISTSMVGPNQLRTVRYGKMYGKNSYSITTLAPVKANGKPNFSKLKFIDLEAGQNTWVSFSQDPITKNWLYNATFNKASDNPYEISAAVKPTEPGQVALGGLRLEAARIQASRIVEDANIMAPVRTFPPPFQVPQA